MVYVLGSVNPPCDEQRNRSANLAADSNGTKSEIAFVLKLEPLLGLPQMPKQSVTSVFLSIFVTVLEQNSSVSKTST